MTIAPNRRVVKIVRGKVLHMSINGSTGAVDLFLRLPDTDLDCRNMIHQAMRRGLDLPLGYEAGEEGPVYEVGSSSPKG